jgi:hypothetical protein
MNSRLGIACLLACALTAFVVADAGCSKYASTTLPPVPTPSPSGSPAPDTIYVQSSNSKVIRAYKGASQDNGLVIASVTLPTGDITNGDVVYDPTSDTLWYPQANQTSSNLIDMWNQASQKNNMNPNALINFPNGEGAAAFDPTHHLLYVATTQGPQVSVYTSPETMMSGATPAAVITLTINDGPAARPQEMLYDAGTDKLYVSDQVTAVSRFDGFGTAAAAAAAGHTNVTIPANSYMQGLFSPDGLAYAPPPTDILFVGEQQTTGDFVAIHGASTWVTGPVGHSQMVTGFSRPGAMAFDNVRGLLFVYDTSPIYVITNAVTATGTLGSLFGAGSVRQIIDGTAQQNIGFGMALDTTH